MSEFDQARGLEDGYAEKSLRCYCVCATKPNSPNFAFGVSAGSRSRSLGARGRAGVSVEAAPSGRDPLRSSAMQVIQQLMLHDLWVGADTLGSIELPQSC